METAVATAPRPTRTRTKQEMTAQQIADKLLHDLKPRFVKLVKATGETDDKGQYRLMVGSHKHACEACFEPTAHYDRIYRAFQGWAEAFARKLGVKQIYANVNDEGEDE